MATKLSIPNNNPKKILGIAALIVGAIILTFFIIWLYRILTLDKRNCKRMNRMYSEFPLIKSFNPNNEDFSHNLRDYYIKTAYNCCAPGNYKNSFVNLCALKNCIKEGVRCLDFQIYALNNDPVIAVSSVSDFNTKQSFNSIPFGDAISIIDNFAFSGNKCPNPGDPLILHFRIYSQNKEIMDKMSDSISSTLEDRVLGPTYSYEYGGKNLGTVPLADLRGKIVIIVDNNYGKAAGSKLDEYVNITSGSVFMQALRYYDVKYTPDMTELQEYNKKQMTICLPDSDKSPENPSSAIAMKYGCQFIAMCFQDQNSDLKYYNSFFNNSGSAFSLKPESLRYVPVTIAEPEAPPESYSYKEREIETVIGPIGNI
jgi:hypothetical protein